MGIVWICIGALIGLGLFAALVNKLTTKGGDPPIIVGNSCDTCDGTNSKCEQECMLEASVKPIEYFDDEELDKFAGRPSDTYGDSEAELFADVLYTMRPDEVAAWMRSLNLRGINLPNQLKDEVFLLIGDNR